MKTMNFISCFVHANMELSKNGTGSYNRRFGQPPSYVK